MSGDTSLCFNEVETYSFDNCKAPGSVTWEVSNHLEVLNSTDFSITVKSGNTSTSGWIKATFNNGIEITKEIFIGPQRPIVYGDNGEQIATFNFCKYHHGSVNFTTPLSALSWEWNQVSGNFNMLASNNQAQFYSPQVTSGLVEVRALDECGWSVPTFLIINFSDCSNKDIGHFKIVQNPTKGGKLEVVETGNNSSNSSQNKITKSAVVNFELYDFSGLMLSKWTKDRDLVSLKYNLDVSKHKKGNYFIRISCEDIS